MSDNLFHLSPEQLEAYAEGGLSEADRAVVDSHLQDCPRCQAELEEWRSLFAALSSLPELEPSPSFANSVMARVQIRQPLPARLAAAAHRLMPKTRLAWAAAASAFILPMLVLYGVLAWLLARPGVTPRTLYAFVAEHAVVSLKAALTAGEAWLLTSQPAVLVADAVRAFFSSTGAAQIGVAAGAFATMTVLSVWILYRNLVRTPTARKATYVSYSF